MPRRKSLNFNESSASDFMMQYQKQTRKELSTLEKQLKAERTITPIPIEQLIDAPAEWNRFPRLKDTNPSRFIEMAFSIDVDELWNPIIVWEQENGEQYMILAGHNRRDCFLENLEKYKGSDEQHRFENVPSIVFKYDELDEVSAKTIILDTNYLQREDNPRLTAWVIKSKLDVLKRTNKKGESVEKIAEEMGLKRSYIYDTMAILNKLNPFFQDMHFDDKIKRKTAIKLSALHPDNQTFIINTYPDKLTEYYLCQLDKKMSREEIIAVFTDSVSSPKQRQFKMSVPEERYDDFLEVSKILLEDDELFNKLQNLLTTDDGKETLKQILS